MSLTNYSELRIELESWSHRDDVTDRLDTFIDLAEAKLWQHLRIRGMETKDATLTASSRLITAPTGFLEARRLRYVSGDNRYPNLQYSPPDGLLVHSSSGTPSAFTVYGSVIELDKQPGSGTFELTYYQKLTPLSTSNATNAIMDEYPNLYLYGGLAELFAWAQDTEEESKWRGKFMTEIVEANSRAKSGRYGPTPAARAAGSTP